MDANYSKKIQDTMLLNEISLCNENTISAGNIERNFSVESVDSSDSSDNNSHSLVLPFVNNNNNVERDVGYLSSENDEESNYGYTFYESSNETTSNDGSNVENINKGREKDLSDDFVTNLLKQLSTESLLARYPFELLKTMKVPENSFDKKIIPIEVPFSVLTEYYERDDNIKKLLHDKIAQMIYALAFVVKGTGEELVSRYEIFFKNLYHIEGHELKKFMGCTFFEFMLKPCCEPYFKINFDSDSNKQYVEFNKSDKEFVNHGEKMVSLRKLYEEKLKSKVGQFQETNKKHQFDLKILNEKLKWLAIVASAPEGVEEICIQQFQDKYFEYYNVRLNKKQWMPIFKRTQFVAIIRTFFSKQLEFVPEQHISNKIRIICDIHEEISKLKQQIIECKERKEKEKKLSKGGKKDAEQIKKEKVKLQWKPRSVVEDIINSV
uniref:RGS domain-containing protein n=1 Tax=Parastrongyloides trichosuri TaxID=131310 RepID=A0A0N4Z4P2_PARTI